MAAIHEYIHAFNRGDREAMTAIFAVPASILDGMAPHLWQGTTAAEDWYRAVLREGEQQGASDYRVEIGEPIHYDVTGDNAYVVAPATMTFRVYGRRITQAGAIYTVALRKLADGWRIAAWAWTKGKQDSHQNR